MFHHYLRLWDLEAKEKIRDSITASFKQEIQKSKASNGAWSVSTWVLHQTIAVGKVSSTSETDRFSNLYIVLLGEKNYLINNWGIVGNQW